MAVPRSSWVARGLLQVVELPLLAFEVLQRIWFVHIPDLALSLPHATSIVKFIFFYIMAQALGLLWGFVVIVLQALSRQVTTWLLSDAGSEAFSFLAAAALVYRSYVTFSTLRMLFLLAGGLWTLAWEASSDFPTVQKLMTRRREGGRHDSSSFVVRAVLVVPLALTTLSFAAVAFAPAICAQTGTCGGWLAEQFLEADGRGNRMLRFSLVILLIQSAQVFISLHPSGIAGSRVKDMPVMQKFAMLFVFPAPFLRAFFFMWRPSDHVVFGSTSMAIFQVSRHVSDNFLVILWGTWVTLQVLWAPLGREVVDNAPRSRLKSSCSVPDMVGAEQRARLVDRREDTPDPGPDKSVWTMISGRFQYTLVISAILYWGRSVISPEIGWSFAQVDLMAFLLLHPFMSVIIWSTTYAFLVMNQMWPRPVIALAALGSAILLACDPGVPTAMASLHLMRQLQKLLGARCLRYSVSDAAGERRVERRWAKRLAYFGGCVLIVWFNVLCFLMLAAAVQQSLGVYPGQMEFRPSSADSEASSLYVGHHAIIGNHLNLSKMPVHVDVEGAYGICNQTWDGLSALDYSLLSLAAYWDFDDPQLRQVLAAFFPHGSGLTARVVNGSRAGGRSGIQGVPWLEVEFEETGMHVITVRGTDPTKIADVVEDIRMWTEPVVLGMLSVAFPTIHVWSGQAVDAWMQTTHSALGVLNMKTGPWTYESLVHHLQSQTRHERSAPRLTGHSLGGAIAQIAAALTGSPVFAISPPGLLQSFMKHWRPLPSTLNKPSSKIRAAHRQSVSIIVEGDWVSLFDAHAGFVQTVACSREDLAPFGGCHLLESTICQLITACGDARQRWQQCSHSFEPLRESLDVLRSLPMQALHQLSGWQWFREHWLWRSLPALCVATALQLALAESAAWMCPCPMRQRKT